MKYFVILLVFVGFFGTVFAVPALDPEQAFSYSDMVIVGKILSVDIIFEPIKSEGSSRQGVALYDVKVLESHKNPDNRTSMTVPGYFLYEPHPMAYETYPYDVDQRVLLYIQKNDDKHVEGKLIIRSGDSKVLEDTLCAANTTFVKGICVVDEPLCGPETVLVDGICHVIETERQGYGPVPPFVDALFFMQIILPFFIPGAIIFVVLSKTPRYSKMTRLSVCIPAIIMILYFLSGLYLGWYPPVYA